MCGIDGKEEKEARMELPKGRERIKFRIRGEKEMHVELGVNMMNGVCKGRKRVSWNHDKINDCMVVDDGSYFCIFPVTLRENDIFLTVEHTDCQSV